MICDYQTNKVYLAEGIKGYPKVAENLLNALYKEGIETEYLPHSKSKKHVWARDFMPIQLEENLFLKYVYNPDYLKSAQEFIPPYLSMIRSLKLKTKLTMFVIDECKVLSFEDGMLIGEIINQSADESILTDGQVDLAKLKPIVFDAAGMCYRALGEVVGKAWGAGKAIAE